MKSSRLAVIAATCLLMGTTSFVSAQNIAVVNGKAVPNARYDALAREIAKSGRPVTDEMKAQIKEELILREIFVQEAEKRGLAGTPEFASQMEMARQSILIKQLVEEQQKKLVVSDADIKAEYDQFVAANSGKEYKTSHILVEKEAEAKDIIARLKKGAKFADIAKKSSIDKGSAVKGGDLDWVSPASLVPEFSAAMVKLNKGQITDTPVKTEYGFHIIRVDDSRATELPKLTDVKPQIEQKLKQRKMEAFQEEMRKKAKIE